MSILITAELMMNRAALDELGGLTEARVTATAMLKKQCLALGLVLVEDTVLLERQQAVGYTEAEWALVAPMAPDGPTAAELAKVPPVDVDEDDESAIIIGIALWYSAIGRPIAAETADVVAEAERAVAAENA